MARHVIASNGDQDLICDTGSLDYIPDPVRHRYGVSTRRPLEDWFLSELDFVKLRFPEHEIFTLGASLVWGEKFITHLTVCEVDTKVGSFEELRRAVRESDQAIRQKIGALWKWDLCLYSESKDNAVLIIGWLDFAYFVQHRKDFMDIKHNRFMAAFASGHSNSTDYKVLHDGTLVKFDPEQLESIEREVFDRASEIRFEVVQRARAETRMPLRMV